MGPFIQISFSLILVFGQSLGQDETDFKKLFREFDTSREFLRNSHVKTYSMNYPPIWKIVENPSNTSLNEYIGSGVDAVNYFAQHYELTVEYVQENASEVALMGQAKALMNAVASKRVDFAIFGAQPSVERMQLIDMTSPSNFANFKILVKFPEEVSRLADVTRPFDLPTWMTIYLTFVVIIGMLSLFVYFGYDGYYGDNITNSRRFVKILSDKIMFVISITTSHGRFIGFKLRLSLRIFLGIWFLMMIVLINAYTGVLTSYMTVPKLKPIPQSLEQLATMKEYKVSVIKDSSLANSFFNASSGTYKVLGDTLRQNPELLYSEWSQAVENVLKYNAANVDAKSLTNLRIAKDLKMNGKCRLTASGTISYTQYYSQMLPKNSPLTKILEMELLRMGEAGLHDYWSAKYVQKTDRCNLDKYQEENSKPRAIRLFELSSPFLVLGVGIGLSTFTFLIERIVFYGMKIREQGKQRVVIFSHIF